MVALAVEDMQLLSGGAWKVWVDRACGGVGVATLFVSSLFLAGAFCAGWALGRL